MRTLALSILLTLGFFMSASAFAGNYLCMINKTDYELFWQVSSAEGGPEFSIYVPPHEDYCPQMVSGAVPLQSHIVMHVKGRGFGPTCDLEIKDLSLPVKVEFESFNHMFYCFTAEKALAQQATTKIIGENIKHVYLRNTTDLKVMVTRPEEWAFYVDPHVFERISSPNTQTGFGEGVVQLKYLDLQLKHQLLGTLTCTKPGEGGCTLDLSQNRRFELYPSIHRSSLYLDFMESN